MPTGCNHLNLEKRSQIYALRATKTSTAEIVRILQCHPSTITREIKRNTGDRGCRYKQWQSGRTSIKLEFQVFQKYYYWNN